MNNNALFLILGGVGLYMYTRTKTSAPVTPGGANNYGPVNHGGYSPAPVRNTPGDVIRTATGVVTDAASAWTTIRDAVSSIKTSVPHSVPSSVPTSLPSNTGVAVPFAAADYGSTSQGIAYGETYGSGDPYNSGGIIKEPYSLPEVAY